MIDNLPKELFPNVEEWLDDKEITEIIYDDFSIKEIMQIPKMFNIKYNFIYSVELMIEYITEGKHNKRKYLNMNTFMFI